LCARPFSHGIKSIASTGLIVCLQSRRFWLVDADPAHCFADAVVSKVESPPGEVSNAIGHVIKAGAFVRGAVVVIGLLLQGADHLGAAVVNK